MEWLKSVQSDTFAVAEAVFRPAPLESSTRKRAKRRLRLVKRATKVTGAIQQRPFQCVGSCLLMLCLQLQRWLSRNRLPLNRTIFLGGI
jgi:hypothetical protein